MTLEGFRLLHPTILVAVPVILAMMALMKRHPARPAIADRVVASGVPSSLRVKLRAPVLSTLCVIFVTLSAIAASRPQRLIEVTDVRSRSLVLCLDVSKSMEAVDLLDGRTRINRLEGVKKVVTEFVDSRSEDRLGLVVFGGRAFLQVPLTSDRELVKEMVKGLEPGMAGDGTAIGDGLGLSLKRIQELPADSKAVILLTDGVNNAGLVEPEKAAHVAADLGIKVHTIGIGSNESALDALSNGFFGSIGTVHAEFDEATLKEIAQTTGGVYFNATSTKGLMDVYSEIDRLERAEQKDIHDKIVEERFPLFASLALGSYLLLLFLSRTVFLKVP